MSKDITIDGQTYTGVSEVELPISGGTALFRDVDEIPEAPETPTSYYELTGGFSGRNEPVSAKFHGTVMGKIQPGNGYTFYWASLALTVDDDLAEIGTGALFNVGCNTGCTLTLTSGNDFGSLTKIGSEAFRSSGMTSAVFPEVRELTGASGGQFAQCKSITEISLPKLTSWDKAMAYNMGNTVLTSVQIGSVGHPITVYPAGGDFGGATNANLTITLYTTPDKAADMRTAFAAGNPTATIVIKDASTGEVIA